jgi:2-keto-4-pentenoate hydratase/2-oxohepta-3-ene-1,7-dioic acid hydratase in catechol pathway
MGPCVILGEAVANPQDMDIELSVNREVRQKDNTRNMLFDIPAIIERLSRRIRLEPGDIIATGTPSGIAPIAPGDLVACRISGIGELRNPVAAPA